MDLLKVENLTMTYGKRAVLDDISLNFEQGKIITLTGKSGAGKSTMLGILSGLQKPQKGKVFYKGKNIFRWGDFRRAHFRSNSLGFVFQFFNLFNDMTAYENILYPVSLNFRAPSDVKKEINDLAELLGISHVLKQKPATLSGGERQRVAIARAVINRPEVVLADEPTGNLDRGATNDIIGLFETLRQEWGITLILATHDAYLVKKADINYYLEDGRIQILAPNEPPKTASQLKKEAEAAKPAKKQAGSSAAKPKAAADKKADKPAAKKAAAASQKSGTKKNTAAKK